MPLLFCFDRQNLWEWLLLMIAVYIYNYATLEKKKQSWIISLTIKKYHI